MKRIGRGHFQSAILIQTKTSYVYSISRSHWRKYLAKCFCQFLCVFLSLWYFWLQKDLDTSLKFRKYSEQFLCLKKKDHLLDEDHSTLYVGILPGIITAFPEDFFFFCYLWLKYGFSSISAQTSFHFSMFLRFVLSDLFPCTYVTDPHQRTQNNSQGIRVHLAWLNKNTVNIQQGLSG